MGTSRHWEFNLAHFVTEERLADLSDFKRNEVNFKLSLWNPQTNGVRYLKMVIYNLARTLSDRQWAYLDKIERREFGNPHTVRYEGRTICLDYAQAVLELAFIADQMPLDGADILEIGAGYGRTCHTLLSNAAVNSYTIVDLPNCLALSRKYLGETLGAAALKRIRFLRPEEFDPGANEFSLCLNIDSFAEMMADTVRGYFQQIARSSAHFYVKNPVGKYQDVTLDGHSQGAESVQYAMETGLLRDVLDIHDNRAVEAAALKFVEAYTPGPDWRCRANGWAPPISYYWQAFYSRSGDSP